MLDCKTRPPYDRINELKVSVFCVPSPVMPAKAGIQNKKNWIPACAGMTNREKEKKPLTLRTSF